MIAILRSLIKNDLERGRSLERILQTSVRVNCVSFEIIVASPQVALAFDATKDYVRMRVPVKIKRDYDRLAVHDPTHHRPGDRWLST